MAEVPFPGARFLYGLRGWYAQRRIAVQEGDADGNAVRYTNDRFVKLRRSIMIVSIGSKRPKVKVSLRNGNDSNLRRGV